MCNADVLFHTFVLLVTWPFRNQSEKLDLILDNVTDTLAEQSTIAVSSSTYTTADTVLSNIFHNASPY